MPWLVSSSRGIDPIRYSRVSRDLGRRRSRRPAECRTSASIASIARSTFAGSTPARTSSGPADARVERAVDVVGHALPLADVVRQPAAEAELAEHVVHHPVRVVARVEAADGGEAVGDVRLRLAGHRRLARRAGTWPPEAPAPARARPSARTSPPAPTRRASSAAAGSTSPTIASARARRPDPLRRGTRASPARPIRSTAAIVPFGLARVGMIRAVEQRRNGIHGAHGGIVVVLPQGGDRLRARLLDLALRKRGPTRDVQQDGAGRRGNPRRGRCTRRVSR